MWQHPEAPSGPISKYIVEIQVAGGSGDPQWMDVDRPEETSIIVRGLNASTRYLFRVRASVQGLGDWSNTVEEATLGNGERMGPVLCLGPSTLPPALELRHRKTSGIRISKLSLCGIPWWPLGSLTQAISTICPSLCLGLQSEGPVQESRAAEESLDQQLVLAVVGSVSATCLTILAALLALVCIRRSCLHRRRTFTYQSGSVSAPPPPRA